MKQKAQKIQPRGIATRTVKYGIQCDCGKCAWCSADPGHRIMAMNHYRARSKPIKRHRRLQEVIDRMMELSNQ